MKTLNELELKEINGGWSLSALLGIGSIFTFLIGIVDGYKPQCLHKRQYFITRT